MPKTDFLSFFLFLLFFLTVLSLGTTGDYFTRRSHIYYIRVLNVAKSFDIWLCLISNYMFLGLYIFYGIMYDVL